MQWKLTRKWEKTKKHKNSKKKLGFVIRQYQFLSMRLRDEENTPWQRETSHEENTELRLREIKRHRRRNHELELECYVISMIAGLNLYLGKMRRWEISDRELDWEFLRRVGYFIYFFLASGYRMAYFFCFFLIFFWNFFQGLKIFLGIFIRGCEFKRIYILVTKLTTFLYIYFKGCVNYFSRVVLIILKVLNKSSNSHTLVFIWTNFSNSWKKRSK